MYVSVFDAVMCEVSVLQFMVIGSETDRHGSCFNMTVFTYMFLVIMCVTLRQLRPNGLLSVNCVFSLPSNNQ